MINSKKYNKPLVVLILASTLLSSVFIGAALGLINNITPGAADYIVIEGVAGNDYYDSRQWSYDVNQWALEQYPGYVAGNTTLGGLSFGPNPANMWFNAGKSLRIGLTEFGEFATPMGVNAGIAYGANSAEWTNTESFASVLVNPKYYMTGWVFYMNYTRVAQLRAVEAWALYSDTIAEEAGRKAYSWWAAAPQNPTGAPNTVAAQLTLGSLQSTGVQVIYDSARLAVGRTSTVIHDGFYNEDVAKVTITVIYQKDSKYAIVYKDVKILLDTKILDNINDFAFSERYEIDLVRNINHGNTAFIHWFEDNGTTVYQHPLTGDVEYDVVQAFDPERRYEFFAAYWPNTTEFAVYSPLVPNLPGGFTYVLPQLTEITDIPVGEPNTPWVIAQWRYQNNVNLPNYFPKLLAFLAKNEQREIRFVEIIGMTDYNNQQPLGFRALDINASDAINNIDIEIQYMLSKVFNPEDLNDLNDATPNNIDNNDNGNWVMWTGLGQSSHSTDSAGALVMTDMFETVNEEPLGLLDMADSAPFKGTVPYALENTGNFVNYIESFSNTGKGTGIDATAYKRTGLNGFAFDFYDGDGRVPQPIAGGISQVASLPGYWYPSKNPLTERWAAATATGAFTASPYDGGNYGTNGILTVGGPKANWISRYFNDYNFAITREGSSLYALANGGVLTGTAPTSDPLQGTLDFFPLSTWNTSTSAVPSYIDTFGYKEGHAVISVARDINGTRGVSVYGWDARDTYWASAWTKQYLGIQNNTWVPDGAVALVLKINYSAENREPNATPSGFTLLKVLGTITEFGYNHFTDPLYHNGFDTIAGTTWQDYVVTPAASNTWNTSHNYWYWEKLKTISIPAVAYDA